MRDVSAWVALLEPIMGATSVDEAASCAIQQLGLATQSVAASCFLVIHGRTFMNFSYPDPGVAATTLGKALEKLALSSARGDAPQPVTLPDGSPLETRVVEIPLKERLTAVMCFAAPSGSSRMADDVLDRVVGLVGSRLRDLQELEVERRRSGQYQRWFQVADRQIRALDLERQKFAALAQAIPLGVYVVDRERVIRWASQPLSELFPRPGAEGTSWVGATCDQFCSTLRLEEEHCTDCLTARVLETRRSVTTMVEDQGAGDSFVLLTASPITNLEGKVHEVMVSVQRLARASVLSSGTGPATAIDRDTGQAAGERAA